MFNWVKTAMLMAAIMALFGVVGGMVGGRSGMLLALVFGGAMNVFSYWFSDKMVLKMYNAQEVDETSAPQFYGMVRDLAHRAGCRCRGSTSSTSSSRMPSLPGAIPSMPRWRRRQASCNCFLHASCAGSWRMNCRTSGIAIS